MVDGCEFVAASRGGFTNESGLEVLLLSAESDPDGVSVVCDRCAGFSINQTDHVLWSSPITISHGSS